MTPARIGPPRDGVTVVEIDGLISVYSPVTQQLLALNESASDVWRLCDGERDLEGLLAALASAYAVAPEEIAADVRRTLSEFVGHGLLPRPAGL